MKNKSYWLYSKHAIEAALRNPDRKVFELITEHKFEKYYRNLLSDIRSKSLANLKIKLVNKSFIKKKIGINKKYQGVALLVEPLNTYSFNLEVSKKIESNFILILDKVGDPNNFGSILRTSFAFGVKNIILLSRDRPQESGLIASIASGALERVNIYEVNNLLNSINYLKKTGWWIIGLESKELDNCIDIKDCKLEDQKKVLIIGSESTGLRKLIRENCDVLTRIRIKEQAIDSLNVVQALAIALYKIS